MAGFTDVTAPDGQKFTAWRETPEGAPRGAVMVLQEIFGVNDHIREVCASYAADGWLAVAPALFDRAAPETFLAYDGDGIAKGRGLKEQVDAHAEGDILAARALVPDGLATAVIGYCWGGSLAWRMACRHDGLKAAVSYYGGEVPALKDETARCPVQAHFGRLDSGIPMEGVEAFAAAQPGVDVHVYEADHGFNCTHRDQHHPESAELARGRVDAFLKEHVG